jgi:malonate decarboxylase epsilon subunit
MFSPLPSDPVVREVFEEANSILGYDVSRLTTAEAERRFEYSQLALLLTGVASARWLFARGLEPDFLAGHSAGAFGSATIAGVISLAEALRLIQLRGRAMQAACPFGYGMAAITGLPRNVCDALIEEVRAAGELVYAASLNAPDQISISGSSAGLQRILALARKRGARKAVPLEISVPSHTPLMHGVADQMSTEMRKLSPRNATIPLMSNRAPRSMVNGAEILEDLAYSVQEPVRWHDITSVLFEAGVRIFVEMHPGEVLTRLAAVAFPEARCLSLERAGPDSVLAVIRSIAKLPPSSSRGS